MNKKWNYFSRTSHVRKFFASLIVLSAGLAGSSHAQNECKEFCEDPSLFERSTAIIASHFDGLDFWVYTLETRKEIIQNLRSRVRADYALYEIKKINMGIDINAEFEKALKLEESIADSDDPSKQAVGNLEFLDRVRRLVATFKDTHFSISPAQSVSPLAVGVFIAEVQGETLESETKFVISGTVPRILGYASLADMGSSSITGISKGDEVVSVDGKDPKVALQELMPFISGSSEGFVRRRATRALTIRSFSLPKRKFLELKIKEVGGTEVKTYRLPWLHRQMTRADQARVIKDRGISSSLPLRFSWDEVSESWSIKDLPNDEYQEAYALKGLIDEKSYTVVDEPESLLIRSGFLLRAGKATAVLQLFSFSESQVQNISNDKELSFLEVVREFIQDAKSNGTNLILDLRSNGGGISTYPPQVLSMLMPRDALYPGRSFAYRITPYIRQLFDSRTDETLPYAETIDGLDDITFNEIIRDAIGNRKALTDAANENDLKSDSAVGGFDQKIVALIAPECISACDNMAMYLQENSRAILIGTHSNGTGAGFSSGSKIGPEWTDTYQVFKSSVPNYLFGRPGGKVGERIFPNRAAELNMENRPAQASVKYKTSVEDMKYGDSKWMDKAIEVLEKP